MLRTIAVLAFTLIAYAAHAETFEERVAPCLACHVEKGQSETEDTPSGVEQRWRFDRAPQGAADLTVRVAVEGARCAGEYDGGVTLSDGDAPRFRYSHGVWVDRDGRRTPVRARCVGGGIALTVPAAVVARSAFPATLDPTITPVDSFIFPGRLTLSSATSPGAMPVNGP